MKSLIPEVLLVVTPDALCVLIEEDPGTGSAERLMDGLIDLAAVLVLPIGCLLLHIDHQHARRAGTGEQ